ncbi:MAG: malonyl-CoA decarboxylase [Paracoccaceae bacterium]
MRTADIFSDLLARVTDAGRAISGTRDRVAEAGPEGLVGLCGELLSGRGEATGLALARDILDRFAELGSPDRADFFARLQERLGVDGPKLAAAVEAWRSDPCDATGRALHHASEPRTQELIRVLNRTPGGTAALIAMRDALLKLLSERRELRPLDLDFRHVFASWFNRGFLQLTRIDWGTSAAILEKIIEYEAVHAIQDWDDLRRRVAAPDRRLYGFFHPALPAEPLIFVEVALTDEIPGAIRPILSKNRTPLEPSTATTAVFYSISNCQTGLRGISFGNFLIKQVVEELRREFPAMRSFVTLSPVPGFRAWAMAALAKGADGPLPEVERAALRALDPVDGTVDAHAAAQAADLLPSIAARYLLDAKDARGQPADPVARFHLGNGARLERVNASADHSARGLANAFGVMVNYLYDLENIEQNHEAYANEGAVIAASAVRRLLRSR